MLLRSLKTSAYILSAALFCQAAQADIEIQTIAEGFDTLGQLLNFPMAKAFWLRSDPEVAPGIELRRNQSISGVPAVFAKRQGGLFDVVLHPDFETNNTIPRLCSRLGGEQSNYRGSSYVRRQRANRSKSHL